MERLKRILPNISTKECKKQALMDIMKECGEGKFYKQNYIIKEKQILNSQKDVRN